LDLLSNLKAAPDELLGAKSELLLREVEKKNPESQVRQLLSRGFQLGQALDNWSALGLWVQAFGDDKLS
jgi:hypothetical protein